MRMQTFAPTSIDQLQGYLEEDAVPHRRSLALIGGGTALRCGFPLKRECVRVELAGLSRVVDYPARDMTITVEAGICVAELQRVLGTERQRLSLDLPQAADATIGGAIATNAGGSRRLGHGTFRDYLIGMAALDGQGRAFHAGGRVVKNVAGYDLCKLMIGSQGSLGILTEVTLKVRPLPELLEVVLLAYDSSDAVEVALQHMVTTATRPVAVDLFNALGIERLQSLAGLPLPQGRYLLVVVLEGSEREVRWQVQTLLDEMQPTRPIADEAIGPLESAVLMQALTEFTAVAADTPQAHLSVPPSSLSKVVSELNLQGFWIQAHAANGQVRAIFPERWSTGESLPQNWDKVLEVATLVRGQAVLVGGIERIRNHMPVMGHRRDDWSIMEGIKQQLDPHDLLNPGRVRFHS